MSPVLWHSFQVFPCSLAISEASHSRSQDTCRPKRQNLALLHCCKGWEHTWIRRCCRLTLRLHWPLGCYCTFQREMENASKPHHQASHCIFLFLFLNIGLSISIHLYLSEGLGIRSLKKSFQVPTWLVFETATDKHRAQGSQAPFLWW